jgi:hypothetical protein
MPFLLLLFFFMSDKTDTHTFQVYQFDIFVNLWFKNFTKFLSCTKGNLRTKTCCHRYKIPPTHHTKKKKKKKKKDLYLGVEGLTTPRGCSNAPKTFLRSGRTPHPQVRACTLKWGRALSLLCHPFFLFVFCCSFYQVSSCGDILLVFNYFLYT